MSLKNFNSQYLLLHDRNLGLTYIELADKYKLPIGTVKSRVNRAREKLDKIFQMENEK